MQPSSFGTRGSSHPFRQVWQTSKAEGQLRRQTSRGCNRYESGGALNISSATNPPSNRHVLLLSILLSSFWRLRR